MSKFKATILSLLGITNSGLKSKENINNRTELFKQRTDEILSRLDKSQHREKLNELREILESAEKDLNSLPNNLTAIDKKFDFFTALLETEKCDNIISLEVNEYRFKYGELLVKLIESVDNKSKDQQKEFVLMAFTQYASRFDNKRARLTDDMSETYVKITSKYANYDVSDMIPNEFKE